MREPLSSTTIADSLLTEMVSEIAIFPVRSRERGKDYALQGRVFGLSIDLPVITARVHGSRVYDVAWQSTDDGWVPDCNCPVGVDCKHTYAVACCVIAAARESRGFADPRLPRLLPPSVPPPRALPPVEAVRPIAVQRRKPTAIVHSPRPKPLRTTPAFWRRQESIAAMIRGTPAAHLLLSQPPFSEILHEPDDEMMSWYFAEAIASRVGGWLPAALEPYRDRPDLAAIHQQRTRERLTEELTTWALQRRPEPDRSLRVVLGLERGEDGRTQVTFEARVSTRRLKDEPRTLIQLEQLQAAVRRTPGLMAPDQIVLLDALTDHEAFEYGDFGAAKSGFTGRALLRVLRRFAGTPALVWDDRLNLELARRAGVLPGAAVELSSELVSLLPVCRGDANGVHVELGFLWTDGRQRSADDVLHIAANAGGGQRGLVLADGRFSIVAEEPPPQLVQLFEQSRGLVIARHQADDVLAPLAEAFPLIRSALAAHTRFYDVRPAVALDLRKGDWLQIRVFARGRETAWRPGSPVLADSIVFEYTPQGRWARVAPDAPASEAGTYGAFASADAAAEATDPAPTPATESAPDATPDLWIEAVEPTRVEPILHWLVKTGAASGLKRAPGGRLPEARDREQGWWLRLSARTADRLATAWDERPDDVDWFGTDGVRNLLTGVRRVVPHLRIQPSGVDWFAVSADWASEGLQITDEDLARLRHSTARFVKLPSGWVRRDAASEHEQAAESLAELGIDLTAGEQRLSVWQLAHASKESLGALAELGAGPEAARTLEHVRGQLAAFEGLPHVEQPAGVHGTLREYQRLGLDFLAYTSSIGLGAILADDMGLGKTLQTLAWLEVLRQREPDGGPALVVCPASVMHNWLRESERFTPGLRVLTLESGEGRHRLRREVASYDLVVTNYSLLRRDIEEWKKIELRAAILDEAQNIKNPDAAISRAVLNLKSRHRLALTGTPLENRALDLWSIMEFVNPGYLGRRSVFSLRYDRADAPQHLRKLLSARLRPVMLRRMKTVVATDLPERIEERRDCEMTRGQRQMYLAELVRSRALVERLAEGPGGIQQHKIEILAALTRLRQICCHPALVGGKRAVGSGKFDALFELLEPLLAEGHKVLLFSQFVECLKLLRAEMTERGIAHHTLTGETTHREQVVTAFQEDERPCVFAISLKAGGTGLNLTAASYVVLFDPWWNPAVEAQAIDRTHRIGQDRTVIAYRMLTQGTIEERIWELQQKKAAIARDVLGEEGFARALNKQDLEYLLAPTP